MSFFKKVFDAMKPMMNLIDYGEQKKDGGHDHRYNRGDDRTPAQKAGDKKRRKRKV